MPSLSTSQLIVLWYAGILIFFTLGNASNELYKVFGIILLAGLILYTLKPLPNANKRKALLWVFLPVPLFILVYASGDWLMEQYQRSECEAALVLIAAEEEKAESDLEGWGRDLKKVLNKSEMFSTPISQFSITNYPLLEEELNERAPGFKNCYFGEREEVVEHWIKKYGKRR